MVSCSPFPLSLPFFRVCQAHTAHLQVCTVIRFSLSRFVPRSKRSLSPPSSHCFLSGCWSVTIPVGPGEKYSFQAFSHDLQAAEHSSVFTTVVIPLSLIWSLTFNSVFWFHYSFTFFLFSPFSFSLHSFLPFCLYAFFPFLHVLDGLSPIWPWLSLWRPIQQLSETFSEGRQQLRHVCNFNTLTHHCYSGAFAKSHEFHFFLLLSFFHYSWVMLRLIDFLFLIICPVCTRLPY